jgi:chemotaxis signal transduction protein
VSDKRASPDNEEVPTARAEQLLAERALVIRDRPGSTQDDEALLWLAEFPLGDDVYAVPLASMRAALPLKGVTSVPLAPAHVVGILRFQGQAIAVLSLASLLGNPGWREDPQTLLVLEMGGGRLVAIDCEQIPRPTAVPLRMLEQARSRSASQARAILELQTADRRQILLLDLHRLLERRRDRRDEA